MSETKRRAAPRRPESAGTPSRKLAFRILVRAARSTDYVDHILAQELGRANLSAVDRHLVTELVNGVVRWQRMLDWVLARLFHGNYGRSSPKLKALLRLGLYQLVFLDKVPAYAAVSETVALAKGESPAWGKLVNAVLRTYLRDPEGIELPRIDDDPVAAISISQSHPEWLVRRWVQRFGVEETLRLCEANNRRPALSLRVNPMRARVADVEEELMAAGVEVLRSKVPGFLRIEQGGDPSHLPPFTAGKVTVQDESAGLAVLLLAPEPGETVIDLCAAPGGKSTHIAEQTRDRAIVVAVDRDLRRLQLLRQGAERLGLRKIFPIVADARAFAARRADRVLLDAPCSGLGVLAKRSDLRWKRTEEQIGELAQLQLQMLNHAATLIDPGGVLVYCTCTVEPEENEGVVESFRATHPDFDLESAAGFVPDEFVDRTGYVRTYPHVHGTDGSFAARLRRRE